MSDWARRCVLLFFVIVGIPAFMNAHRQTSQVAGSTSAEESVRTESISSPQQQPNQDQVIGSTSLVSSIGGGPDTSQVTSLISQNLGLPYKDFGFKDADGQWVRFDGAYDYTKDTPGYNCAGFVAQVVRDLYGSEITLEQLAQSRSVAGELSDSSGADRALFGRDMIRNIADLTGGHSIASPGESIDDGFRPFQYQTLWLNVQVGQIYFLDVYKDSGSRLDFHVAVMLPTEDGIMVYEATNYWAPGQSEASSELSLEDFLSKYSDSKYGILAVECPLPTL